MRNRPQHKSGYTIVDMLLALFLLGIFSLIAYRLVSASVHLTASTLLTDDHAARFDTAMQQLRSDVRHSKSIDMPDPSTVRIQEDGNRVIVWTMEQVSLRRLSTETRRWDIGRPLALKLDGRILLIAASPADQIALAPPLIGASR